MYFAWLPTLTSVTFTTASGTKREDKASRWQLAPSSNSGSNRAVTCKNPPQIDTFSRQRCSIHHARKAEKEEFRMLYVFPILYNVYLYLYLYICCEMRQSKEELVVYLATILTKIRIAQGMSGHT